VFVPLLFLTGVSSVLFVQLSIVVMFSLAMSLFVAVTVVPVLCSRLLRLPVPIEQRSGLTGRLFTTSERALSSIDNGYRRLLHRALRHRPTVIGLSAALTTGAFLILPTIPTELVPPTDEGEVTVSARLASGTRVERTEQIAQRIEELVRGAVPEARDLVSSAGGGGFMGGSPSSVNVTVKLKPRAERTRSSDRIAADLRDVVVGIPGTMISTRASGGNQQLRAAATRTVVWRWKSKARISTSRAPSAATSSKS
jgi:HAE1 family hydrophobic/amphiphilic exporter-1